MPEQIEPLAEHLGVTVEKLFRRKLAVGVTAMPGGKRVHGIMPHKLRDGKKAGTVWSLDELADPGRCVFFDRGKCGIYKFRPFECARMMHDRPDEAVKLRHRIVPRWTETTLQAFGGFVGVKLSHHLPNKKR